MTSRLAFGSAIAAVVVAIAVLSMHVVDAHPTGDAHSRHDQVTAHGQVPAHGLTRGHGGAEPSPVTAPHAATARHDDHTQHAQHVTHVTHVTHESATALTAPVLAPRSDFSWDTAARANDPTGAGHGNAFAHHFSMCAAVILAALSSLHLRASRRVSWLAVRRLIGTSLGLDPPVPRPVFVLAP